MTYSKERLAIASKLFSSAVFQQLARRGNSPLFTELLKMSNLPVASRNRPVSRVFEDAFRDLQRVGCRDEYVYKSALITRLVLGKHSLKTACALGEFGVGGCKADIVILNGTSTVYEVKSERDTLSRLDKQLEAYSQVFSKVYVVAADVHLDAIERSVPLHVGIMRVCGRFRTSTIREASDISEHLSTAAIFDCLRTDEAAMLLSELGWTIPTVANTELRSVIADRFLTLSSQDAHMGMVRVLKKTRSLVRLSDLLKELPPCLHAAALTIRIRRSDCRKLVAALNTPVKEALCWG